METWAAAVRAPRGRGEEVRRRLLEEGRLRLDLKIRREGEDLLFPVEDPTGTLPRVEFERARSPPPHYSSLVKIPKELQRFLPSSFDVVGEIALIKLPEVLLPHRHEVGRALLTSLPSLRAVFLDRGVRGVYRIRDLERIAGEGGTRTTVVEHKVRLSVDLSTCYFSPRLASERWRIAQNVQRGERVLDLFAGVGPFSLVLAKHAHPERVVAVDSNPEAYRFLLLNISQNRTKAPVEGVLSEAREFLRRSLVRFDRIILNLPHEALGFIPDAVRVTRAGGLLHVGAILDRGGVEEVQRRIESEPWGLSVEHVQEVRSYSPRERHFVFDVRVQNPPS